MTADMGRNGYVYILASQKNGTLYTGVTSDIAGRLLQHQTGYRIEIRGTLLVWYGSTSMT